MSYHARTRLFASTIVTLLGSTACFGNIDTQRAAATEAPLEVADTQDAAQAPASLGEALTASTSGVIDGLIHLPRSMIGMRLLESTEVAVTGAYPDIAFVKPRIVYFALYNDQLALFESNSVSPHRDLRADHLIDTFPVLRLSPETVVIAPPQRLRGISTAHPWDIADAALNKLLPRQEGVVLDVDHAVLEDVSLHDQTLRMRHALTVRANQKLTSMLQAQDGVVLSTRYVRTTFSPYEPSPTFHSLEIPGTDGRYFQVVTVTPNTAELSYRAMHWDTDPTLPPITFGLSRQMSPQVAQAVQEGLDYWNKAAGRRILRVERDVDLDTWEGPRQVPVHWITWDTSAESHAAIQADPLTGEIIAGKMFLTSGFPLHGLRMFNREARLAAQEDPQVAASHAAEESLSQSLKDRAQKDTVRLLAAHEAGHILGLRHNFAGMLDSELTDSIQMQHAARAYIRGGVADQRIASTVMTYAGARSWLLLGSYINQHPLPYDMAAMALLYARPGEEAQVASEAFCSDFDVGHVYGCAQSLDGTDVLRDSADKARAARFDIAISFLEGLLKAVQRNGGKCDAKAFNYLSLDAMAEPIRQHAEVVLGAFQCTDAMVTQQQYGPLKHLDPSLYRMSVRDHITKRARDVGGLPGWIGHVLDAPVGSAPDAGWLQRDIAFHIAQGSLPALSAAPEGTRLWIEQIALGWSDRIEQLVIKKMIEALTGQRNFSDVSQERKKAMLALTPPASYPADMVDFAWEAPLSALATELILATRDNGQPKYLEDVRVAAAQLLSPHVFNLLCFGEDARESIVARLTTRIAEAIAAGADRVQRERALSDMNVLRELQRLN